ncbi:MAG: hypothetical protein ACKPB3_02090, partial [Bacteroidota bacterium]
LSRTINTSLTIFFVLMSIFIFGGEVIRGFTFALLMVRLRVEFRDLFKVSFKSHFW